MPHHDHFLSLLWFAIALMGSRLFGGLAQRLRQPEVVGEIAFGTALISLSSVFPALSGMKHDIFFLGLAEFGLSILLFKVGLGSNIYQMLKTGPVSFQVAVIGVVAPFMLGGFVVGPWLFPDMDTRGHLFVGGILVATSVGVTARVLTDRNVINERAGKIIVGAAVIDDILGLIVLAFLQKKDGAEGGMLGIALHLLATVLTLVVAIAVGHFVAPRLNALFSKISEDPWMRLALPLAACFISTYLAKLVGLAPIIGAFAAGLVLQEVHFKDFREHETGSVEALIEPLEKAFTPVFFVLTGMNLDLSALLNPASVRDVLILTTVSIGAKVIAGLPAGKKDRWIVGWGMAPRGEVGLIMIDAAVRAQVLPNKVAAVMLTVVLLSTIIPLPNLDKLILKRYSRVAP